MSELNGVITDEEAPVSGAVVHLVARVVFNNKEFKSTTVTDENGHFHFDAIHSKSVNKFLPSAKMVDITITVQNNSKEYNLLSLTKNNYEENGEFNYFFENEKYDKSMIVPFELQCDLQNPRQVRLAPNNEFVTVKGICRWNGE